MNKYIEALKRYVAENSPNYGDGDVHSILEMLFIYYHECNNTDNDAVKAAFEDLYQQMHGMPLREMDRIIDAVCTLYQEHGGGEDWVNDESGNRLKSSHYCIIRIMGAFSNG